MNEMLTWVQTNQAALIAISTVVTAVATVVMAWLNGTLVRENRRLRKAGTEPEVVAYLLPDRHMKILLNFVLANIGQGSARNVTFSFVCDQDDFSKHNVEIRNNERWTPISILPQNESMD